MTDNTKHRNTRITRSAHTCAQRQMHGQGMVLSRVLYDACHSSSYTEDPEMDLTHTHASLYVEIPMNTYRQ